MTDVVIRAEGLGKRYRISHQREGRRAVALFGGARKNEDFWALNDVSFEIERGEAVGIIGHNGAGKSTLLKILSRITKPTEGRARIRGRVGSLLEVGTGFHRELTGRENIYLNGAILGMRKGEIDRKLDEIVDFAGIERFIDTPVKHYSSGMYVRLAFAVAAHLESSVLMVDEVLAVGDVAFQKKCLGTMDAIAKEGRTVLFVSHNMGAVRNLCSRALLLTNGRIELDGPADDVVPQYLGGLELNWGSSLSQRTDRSGDGRVRAVGFEARVPEAQKGGPPRTGAPVEFVIEYDVAGDAARQLYAGMLITDSSGVDILTCSTSMSNSDFCEVQGRGRIVCHLDYLPLKPGKYWVSTKLLEYVGQARYRKADEVINAASFDVVEGGESGFVDYGKGPVVVPHQWLRHGSDDESAMREYRRP